MTGLSDRSVTEAELANFTKAVCDKLEISLQSPAGRGTEMLRETLCLAQEIILRNTADLGSSEANPFRGGYSFSQPRKVRPTVMRLRYLEAACLSKASCGMTRTTFRQRTRCAGIKVLYFLYLAAEVLLRPFVRKEIYWAIHYKKKIVLVWQQDGDNTVGRLENFSRTVLKKSAARH